jgi:ribonuclease HII
MPKKKRTIKTASLKHERKYLTLGYKRIIGIDEVGRGPWAGPVVAGAVCLPLEYIATLPTLLKGVRDSKQMTPLQREKLSETIKDVAVIWGIGSASAQEIDAVGINPANQLAMRRALDDALKKANFRPDCLFLDDMFLPEIREIPQVSMIEGDARSLSVAAASVLAKVWRDSYMVELDSELPHYGFADHKGYGTERHRQALEQYGPSPVHRMYYKPLQSYRNHDTD